MTSRLNKIAAVSAITLLTLLGMPSMALEIASKGFYRCHVIAATEDLAFVQVPANSEEAAREFAGRVIVTDRAGVESTTESVVQCLPLGKGEFSDLEFQEYVDQLDR